MNSKNIYWILLLFIAGGFLGYIAYTYSLKKDTNHGRGTITEKPDGYKIILEQTEHPDREVTNQKSISGTASIKSRSKTFKIDLFLNGLKPNTRYNSHLHRGNCDQGGAGGTQLEPVISNSHGRGSSKSIVRYDEFNPSMDHIIMVHDPTGHHVLCGEIPAIKNIRNSGQ